jgi:hypothetical protein
MRLSLPDSFPPPWSVEELDGCMIVWDRNGQAITYVYFEDDPRVSNGTGFAASRQSHLRLDGQD